MELNIVIPGQSDSQGVVEVSDAVFDYKFNEALIHQVVTAYRAGSRAGTHAQKTRSEVSGGGAKPWRQKGTGNARAGTIRSPLWRGGGVTFAAKNRDYSQKVNKKMYKGALKSIVSELLRQERLVVVESLSLEAPKTKLLKSLLESMNLSNVLLVTETVNTELYLAARNLVNVNAIDVNAINPVDLLKYNTVVMTKVALQQLGERLA